MEKAIIRTGGKQYLVSPGEKLKIEKIEKKEGAEFTFSDGLFGMDSRGNVEVGTPVLKDVKVTAKVLQQARGPKLIVFRYKAKKRYRKKKGHRQPFTEVKILSIGSGSKTKKAASKEPAAKKVAPKKVTAKK